MLDRSGLGVLLLVSDGDKFERTVTDGDLRRLLLEGATLDEGRLLPLQNGLRSCSTRTRPAAKRSK